MRSGLGDLPKTIGLRSCIAARDTGDSWFTPTGGGGDLHGIHQQPTMELPTLLILAALFLGEYHCAHSHIIRHLAVSHSSSKEHCDCRPLLHRNTPSV
jgi:hypothetical protein